MLRENQDQILILKVPGFELAPFRSDFTTLLRTSQWVPYQKCKYTRTVFLSQLQKIYSTVYCAILKGNMFLN